MVCGILDKMKNKEADSAVKDEFEQIVKERVNDESCIEMIKNSDDHILLLAMRVIKKLII